MPQSSRIFLKNRALGHVSNHIPCITRYISSRQENVIVTCVGKALHSYGANHLSLLTVSEQTEEEITCLASVRNFLFTAEGPMIHSWKRSSVISKTFKGHQSPVHLLLPIGQFLISIDESNILKVWIISTQEEYVNLTFDIPTFKISTIIHPYTYADKILLGSKQGRMQLWNLKSSKLVYTFDGWDASILVLEQSPALDVVAIGLDDGRIILHNIKFDETIVQFKQECGPVTTLSFRTDNDPIMVSGSSSGHIMVWDLEEKKVASQIFHAHKDLVSSAIYLPGEPLLVTSSPDNSVKMWIFDQHDKGGRILRKREGHYTQPKQVRFYLGNENHILCAGGSGLRVFNVINESMNYSLGEASYNKKISKRKGHHANYLRMPDIAEYSYSTARSKEWDNIAVTHMGIPTVTTWSYEKRRMGDHKLTNTQFGKKATLNITATSVHVTNCGNFVIIGYSSGNVERFNLQSGIHRCCYGDPVAHNNLITGVCVDTLNQFVITGCCGGLIKFWDFFPKQGATCVTRFVKTNLKEPVAYFRVHLESSLIAVALDDFSVVLVDVETKQIVRKLIGHTAQITDVTFSPDARWIITASIDRTIRTWDIPTSSLIDIFMVDTPCISLSMSPSGQYLATTHTNNMGICLWSNITLFTHVSFKPIKETEEIPVLSLPNTLGGEVAIELEADDEPEEMDNEETKSRDQIENLITLSGLSTSRWTNLLDIDVIRARNKHKQTTTSQQVAPFFLPTIPSLELKFDLSTTPTVEERLKDVSLEALSSRTLFAKSVANTEATGNFTPVIEKLKQMGPSAIHAELNSFGFDITNSAILIKQFLNLIRYMFSTNQNFELAQSYLGLLLKIHGEIISQSNEILDILKEVQKVQEEKWDKIQNNIQYCLCVIEALKL